MTKALQSRLDPVRRRQQQVRSAQGAAWGLLAASVALLALAVGRWLAGWPLSIPAIVGAVVVGPLVGAAVGMLWRRDWHAAARAIDSHYRLKDRAASALEFLTKPGVNGVHQLAVDDALTHLGRVDAKEVVPLRAPRPLPYAIVAMMAAAVVFVVTTRPVEVVAGPTAPLDVVVASADRMDSELEPLKEIAKEEKDPELEQLVAEIQELLEAMREPDVDVREAMAKLSEIESALQEQQNKYNLETVDAELKAVGEAMELAEPLAAAGQALSAGEYEKAADELAKLDTPPQLDRKTEKTVKEKLDELTQRMSDSGQKGLSEATGDLSKGMSGDRSRFKEGAKKLSSAAKKQAKRKKLQDLLRKQCQACSECKGECECECDGDKINQNSKKGGNKWGLGASGNELGDATQNLGGKQEMRLTGKQSDAGESEIETTKSPEGEEEARRGYREAYTKYRKLSEAVLESEPIPLGHRQTIRRYFEAIRPQEGAMAPESDEK